MIRPHAFADEGGLINDHQQAADFEGVLVVGAGPVGLVLAADLLRQGVPVRVVDRATGTSPHSRAIVVWPRTMELLRRLRVADRLCEHGHRLDAVSFYSDRARLGSVDICCLADTPYPFALTIPQVRTEQVLRERLSELGGRVERGVRLVGLDAAGQRPVALLEHPDGSAERIRANWVVGADGTHSTVREQLGIGFPPEGGEVLFAIGDAPVGGNQSPHELVYAYSRHGALGVAPLADGAFRIAFSVPRWSDAEVPQRELFQEMVDRLAPNPGVVDELRWSTVFRAQRRIASTFRIGRCFLAGDAAHVFSAAGAQGMNTGIQDAVNLGWRLGGVIRGVLDPAVLDHYDGERRRAVSRVSLNTQRQTEWGLLQRRASIAVRDVLVRAADRCGLLQRVAAPLMSQTDVDYGPSVGLVDPPWQLRPGIRLPVFAATAEPADPAVPWPAVNPDFFALLLWSGGRRDRDWRERCAAIRDGCGSAATVLDVSGWTALHRALGSHPVAVLVRPDGHVAAVTPSAEPETVQRALHEAGVRRPEHRPAPRPAGTAAPALLGAMPS